MEMRESTTYSNVAHTETVSAASRRRRRRRRMQPVGPGSTVKTTWF